MEAAFLFAWWLKLICQSDTKQIKEWKNMTNKMTASSFMLELKQSTAPQQKLSRLMLDFDASSSTNHVTNTSSKTVNSVTGVVRSLMTE